MKTVQSQLIGEYKQQDGWHPARTFDSIVEARDWISRTKEAGGHHHARRFRRVNKNSSAWNNAINNEICANEI